MTIRLRWGTAALCTALALTACRGKKNDSSSKDEDKKSAAETDSGGDPADGISACSDWRTKLSACEPLKKTAPSLIDKTKDVWRMKKLSKSDIESDCKSKIESLPKSCR
jgi:hypothetical protein